MKKELKMELLNSETLEHVIGGTMPNNRTCDGTALNFVKCVTYEQTCPQTFSVTPCYFAYKTTCSAEYSVKPICSSKYN